MASNTLVVLALTLTLATLFSSATPSYLCPWCPPTPTPPTPAPPPPSSCPIDALKLGVCANVLGGLINGTIGHTPDGECCPLIAGLVDVEVTACLCIALNLNILGSNHVIPLYLPVLLNYCGKQSSNFKCP
ncbi:pEARLI1-like lipid transfer protein 2 [Ananas comosus]|uniref:PEARLI1-like lipid transfer protein 2 n=1 Tax=Ananas comosus TaxID=4615 RepID=A0A6P5EHX3_ANACO|nr:pEARLI1-like lipid transfer protein 2 [Ananas comosus]